MNILQVFFCPVVPIPICLANRFLGNQSTRNGATNPSIVDQCVDFQLRYLPLEASTIIAYIASDSTANPSNLFNVGLTNDAFDHENAVFFKDHRGYFRQIRDNPWTIVPIGINGHYTIVIIHARLVPRSHGRRAMSILIRDIVVAYPLRNPTLKRFIYERLRCMFIQKRGFIFERDQPVDFWYPRQGCDRHACGFRVYEIIRIMITRISQYVAEGGLTEGFNLDAIWRGLSGMCFKSCPSSVSLDAHCIPNSDA